MLLFKQGRIFYQGHMNKVITSIEHLLRNICPCVVYVFLKFSAVEILQSVVVSTSYVTIVTAVKKAF